MGSGGDTTQYNSQVSFVFWLTLGCVVSQLSIDFTVNAAE